MKVVSTDPGMSLLGSFSATPGVGPKAGDQTHPLSIPAPAIVESTPATEQGPSVQASQYTYNTKNFTQANE